MLSDITGATSVTDAVDALNEALLNVSNNTFVRSVDFVSDVTAGGLNLSVTLTITAEGNANRFTIAWGDGSTDVATSDSTPSHTYTDDTNSPYDVTVTAFNSARVEEGSAGSEASLTKQNFITAFTADPVAQWEFYTAPSGGTEITTEAAHNQTADFTLYAQWTANPTTTVAPTTTTAAPTTTTTTAAPTTSMLPATGSSNGTLSQVLLVLGVGGLLALVARRRLNVCDSRDSPLKE